MFGRGIAHLTIYLPALALYLIVLPRIYGFSTLGHLPQIFALATVFLLATSFMGQAIGAWFTRPENATLLLLATSLPQFFTAGFAWPREAIPDAAIALGRIFPADFAIDGLVRINQLGASIWEVAHDWLGLWCLALVYFALAVISALAVKRRTETCAGLACRHCCDRTRACRGRPDLFPASCRSDATIVGVVRATEVRVEPEVNGQLVSIAVEKGAEVHAGDVLARLSAVELTAQADQARAALASATANRNNVYAGVRREQIASLKAESPRQAPASTMCRPSSPEPARWRARVLSPSSRSTRPKTTLQAHVPMWRRPRRITMRPWQARPEERAIADAQVQAAAAAVTVLERRLEKMILRAPADGVVSVIAAEVGENVRAGQPILMVEAAGKQWLSFNAREDHLSGLTIGKTVSVMRNGTDGAIKAVITELRPLGTFATWQAERVIGDHDRNTLRLRLDPEGEPAGLEPGMTVWIEN